LPAAQAGPQRISRSPRTRPDRPPHGPPGTPRDLARARYL